MLSVHLSGPAKENRLIQTQGVSSFKTFTNTHVSMEGKSSSLQFRQHDGMPRVKIRYYLQVQEMKPFAASHINYSF
jgi:hypothetical protein